jgi:hypothetical protein
MGKKKAAAALAVDPQAPGEIVATVNGLPIRRIRVSEIDAAHYNPREISEKALAGLKASVDEFGLVEPLVYNVRTRRLVGGHQRLKTLDPNSFTEVTQVDLDEIREKALNALLNDRSKQGDWTASIGEMLDEIEAAQPELFSRVALDDLRVEIPSLEGGDSSVEGLEDVSETIEADSPSGSSRTECPRCGHIW